MSRVGDPAPEAPGPRPLTERERATLVWMIDNGVAFSDEDEPVTSDDRRRWRAQVPGTRVGRGCGCGACPSIDLTDADGVIPGWEESRIVLSGETDGAMLLLFVDDDRLSYLELAPLDDDARFAEFPPEEELTRLDPPPSTPSSTGGEGPAEA
ncbi:hypothetical protein ACFFKU_04235 [Kineococcus gynurae]|uniref:Uncharacterized protein n=1 Tax=Kineococcus gynurae TaxID=452979 RepID=A0ABV5LRK9_9ACTN